MKKGKGNLLLAAVLGLLLLTGCTSQKVHTVVLNPVEAGLSKEQVGQAILNAGKRRRWEMSPKGRNLINARVYVRQFMAAVDINYDRSGYSISYADSKNLDYDGKTIHRSFNKWVILLEREINRQLEQAAR